MEDPLKDDAREDAIQFHCFKEFHEDIIKLILSFVADAPREFSPERGNVQAGLTHILPFVSKNFRNFAELDYFWEPALLRQLNRQDSQRYHWQQGLRRLLPPSFQLSKGATLLDEILNYIDKTSYKEIYKKVLTNHIQATYPIFIMPCQLRLGEVYGLHLFEPRYRIMISSLLEKCGNPQEASRGGKIEDGVHDGVVQPPLLVHAFSGSRLGPGEGACLVQLVWCRTYEYGTADVQLLPIAWVRLDKIWVRPSSGHLFYSKATRV